MTKDGLSNECKFLKGSCGCRQRVLHRIMIWIMLICTILPSPWTVQTSTAPNTDISQRARQALEYVELVRSREKCTGSSEETLPITFDHSLWRHYAEVAVRMSNLVTKMIVRGKNQLRNIAHELLPDMVRNNVDGDSLIFGSAIGLEEYVNPKFRMYGPYSYRKDKVYAHDLAVNYDYFSPISEWYHILRITNWTNAHMSDSWVLYKYNETAHNKGQTLREPMAGLEDGHWTYPYYDCGGGEIWMVTYSAPIFGMDNNTGYAIFRGVGTIDIELTNIDINQCDLEDNEEETEIEAERRSDVFRGTHRCQPSTRCRPQKGRGFVRGAYVCVCEDGYYFPQLQEKFKMFNGTLLEELFAKKNKTPSKDEIREFQCLKCAEGCDTCVDSTRCLYAYNLIVRATFLALTAVTMTFVIVLSALTVVFKEKRVVRSASPIFLHVMCAGALLICVSMLIKFFELTGRMCILSQWPHHLGFALSYGALLLKTWRISAIFSVMKARRLEVTDSVLGKGFIPIIIITVGYLTAWTALGQGDNIWLKTNSGLKFKYCSGGWWEYGAFVGESCFLIWGAYLCFVVRKAPSLFNESKYITWSLYNCVILGSFIILIRELIAAQYGPDITYILDFAYVQVCVTIMMCLIFIPKFLFIYINRNKDESPSARETITGIPFPNDPQLPTKDTELFSQGVQTDITQIKDEPDPQIEPLENEAHPQIEPLKDEVHPQIEHLNVLVSWTIGEVPYNLIYALAKGDCFGSDQAIHLRLLGIGVLEEELNGVIQEITDCGLPLLKSVIATENFPIAWQDLDVAVLINILPHKDGIQKELEHSVKMFTKHGQVLNQYARKTVKVLVVGHQANTNSLICKQCAPSVPPENFTCLTRQLQNRVQAQIASYLNNTRERTVSAVDICNVIIWGSQSSTLFADVSHCLINLPEGKVKLGKAVQDEKWLENTLFTEIQNRELLAAEANRSGFMSITKAISDHLNDWWFGTEDRCVSMGVISGGSYGVEAGLIYSFPVTIDKNRNWTIVEGLDVSDTVQGKIDLTTVELKAERDTAVQFCQVDPLDVDLSIDF